jgi:hypothetical protein
MRDLATVGEITGIIDDAQIVVGRADAGRLDALVVGSDRVVEKSNGRSFENDGISGVHT